MRANALPGIGWTIAAFACALAAAPAAAQAQDQRDTAYASASPASDPTDNATPQADDELTPEDSAALGNALIFDPANFAGTVPDKPLRLPSLPERQDLDLSRTDKPDGSSTVVVKQPLASEWGATVGADLKLAASPPDRYQPRQSWPATTDNRGSGAAWASIGVPNVGSLDARVDPSNDQGKLGTTFKQSIPVGGKFSVTLQDSYSVTETFSPPATTPAELALMATPPIAATTPSQVWGNEKTVKFNILPTGTTLAAGLASSNTDAVTHNTLSADQKLYGPLHVTTAVTDFGQPASNKSITAGFKLHW